MRKITIRILCLKILLLMSTCLFEYNLSEDDEEVVL